MVLGKIGSGLLTYCFGINQIGQEFIDSFTAGIVIVIAGIIGGQRTDLKL